MGYSCPRLRIVALAARNGDEVVRVAVTTGPGGFTGLRVGVSTALGLAVARQIPVVAVSSLAARAALVPGEPRVLALLDARKGVLRGLVRYERPRTGEPGSRAVPPGDAIRMAPLSRWVGVVFVEVVRSAGGAIAVDAGASPASRWPGWEWSAPVDAGQVQLRYIRPPDAKVPRQLAGVPAGRPISRQPSEVP